MKAVSAFLLLIFGVFAVLGSVPQPKVHMEFVMPSQVFPYCHVCSMVERPNGNIVYTFHAGSGEDQPDCHVYRSIRDHQTGSWGKVDIAAQRTGWCTANPCLYQNDEGRIFVTFHSGDEFKPGHCSTHSWDGYYTYSDDGGVTFEKNITKLPKGCLGCIKNKCIKLSNGEVLCPSSTEAVLEHLVGIWQAHMETTDDNFSSFKKRNSIDFFYSEVTKKACQGVIQPTLFEVGEPGHVFALLRSSCGVLAESHSDDYGHTWPEVALSSKIPNPGAGVDGVVMSGQDDLGMLLAFNNNSEHRTPLTISNSLDGGKTWNYIMDVEFDPKEGYAYPAIIQSKQNPRVAHLCYSYSGEKGERNMRYVRLDFS